MLVATLLFSAFAAQVLLIWISAAVGSAIKNDHNAAEAGLWFCGLVLVLCWALIIAAVLV